VIEQTTVGTTRGGPRRKGSIVIENANGLQLKPLGAQGAGFRYSDVLELVRLCDGARLVSPREVVSFDRRVPLVPSIPIDTWQPPPGKSIYVRSALPVRISYRCVSLALTGKLPQALAEARAAVAAGDGLVSDLIVAEAWNQVRAIVESASPVPAVLPGQSAARVQLEARLRGERVRALLPSNAAALRRELFEIGVRDGGRMADLTGLLALFGPRASKFVNAMLAMAHGELASPDYSAELLERGGLPMCQSTFGRGAAEVRAALERDPTFDVTALPATLVPSGRTAELEAIEAQVDAELLARR
jgi:hypothetical protein